MKYALRILFFLLITSSLQVFAQAGKEKTPGLIKSKKFTFYATSARPQNGADIERVMRGANGNSGSNVSLDPSRYQILLYVDSLSSYLPYFGRTFSASTDLSERGMEFISKDFTYQETVKKKGGWIITMKTNDQKDTKKLIFEISTTGYASLSITSPNRTSISYTGYVDSSSRRIRTGL